MDAWTSEVTQALTAIGLEEQIQGQDSKIRMKVFCIIYFDSPVLKNSQILQCDFDGILGYL